MRTKGAKAGDPKMAWLGTGGGVSAVQSISSRSRADDIAGSLCWRTEIQLCQGLTPTPHTAELAACEFAEAAPFQALACHGDPPEERELTDSHMTGTGSPSRLWRDSKGAV